ncbi:hypothetical protein [Cellulosilyticum ruminicola]|uniref:hypothetical protein n=1 Tax=Cellulosilyticum ruminicola TaxID=425254 RepID=UPI0006D2B187|nr:hypothetical protein [Cellulosilyticum ruminicola]
MKIKLIFLGDEVVDLREAGLMYGLKSTHYYKKVSTDLYEYVHVKQAEVKALYHEVSIKSEMTVLVVLETLNEESIAIIKDLKTRYLGKLHAFIKDLGANKAAELKVLNQAYNYVPDIGIKELVKQIFKNWQYVYTLPCVTLNLYSKDEVDLIKISEIEDVFYDYVGEETKFILNWYKHDSAGEEVYFLAEGSQNN